MPHDEDEDAQSRGRRLGKRYSLAVFVAFAAAFIVLSTWEIVAGVFALDAPGQVAAHGRPGPACTQALRAFAEGFDRGKGEKDGPGAVADLEAACAGAGGGSSADLDALAAARRFHRASGADATEARRRRPEEIPPLRRDLDAYLAP